MRTHPGDTAMSRSVVAFVLALGLSSSTIAHAQSSSCCCCCAIAEDAANDLVQECFDRTCGVVINAVCNAVCSSLCGVIGIRAFGFGEHAHADHLHPPHVVVAAAPSDVPMAY